VFYGNSLRTLLFRFKRRRGSLDGRTPGIEYSHYRRSYDQIGNTSQSTHMNNGVYDPRIEYQIEEGPNYHPRADHHDDYGSGTTPPLRLDPVSPPSSIHPLAEVERAIDEMAFDPRDEPHLDIQPMIDAALVAEDHTLHQQDGAEMTQPLFEHLMAETGAPTEEETERTQSEIAEDPTGDPRPGIRSMIDASVALRDSDPFAMADAQFDHAMELNTPGEAAEYDEMSAHDPFASPLEQMVDQAMPEPDPWDMQDPYQQMQMLHDQQMQQLLNPFQMPGPMM